MTAGQAELQIEHFMQSVRKNKGLRKGNMIWSISIVG
jgi:hypothetical protein